MEGSIHIAENAAWDGLSGHAFVMKIIGTWSKELLLECEQRRSRAPVVVRESQSQDPETC